MPARLLQACDCYIFTAVHKAMPTCMPEESLSARICRECISLQKGCLPYGPVKSVLSRVRIPPLCILHTASWFEDCHKRQNIACLPCSDRIFSEKLPVPCRQKPNRFCFAPDIRHRLCPRTDTVHQAYMPKARLSAFMREYSSFRPPLPQR